MISDVLSDAISSITDYQEAGHYCTDCEAWINNVKAVMHGMMWYLDSQPPYWTEALPPDAAESLPQYIQQLEDRLGMKMSVKRTSRFIVEVELLSPTGIPVVGGLLWWIQGQWLFGGFPKQYPEWWAFITQKKKRLKARE